MADLERNVLLAPKYAEIGKYNEGMFAYAVAPTTLYGLTHWGFVNADGQVVTDPIYTNVEPFHEGIAAACAFECSYIDKTGKTLFKWNGDRGAIFNSYDNGVGLISEQVKQRLYGFINYYIIEMGKNPPKEVYTVLPTIEQVKGIPARTFAQWVNENKRFFE